MSVQKNTNKESIIKLSLIIFFIIMTTVSSQSCSTLKTNFNYNQNKSHPIPVEVSKIQEKYLIQKLDTTGTLESPQSTELTSEIAGKIIHLDIPEGQFVNKDHLLAKINNTTNKAEIEVAEAKLENAKTNYSRIKALKDEGAVSQQTLDNAQEALRIAEGEFNRINSINSMTEIRAPFSGVLSIRKVSLGEYIDPGDPIVRISQIDPLNIIFSLPEQHTAQIKTNQSVKFKISNSTKDHLAKVTVIDPYIDPDTRTVKIKASIQNPNKELLPGKFADVTIEVSSISNAISIPEEAIIQEGNRNQVAIVSKDNVVAFKEVTIDKWKKDTVIISSGLMTGDTIITAGHQKVSPGNKVIPKHTSTIHNPILDKEIPK